MSFEIEDRSPSSNITPAGEVVPSNYSLNIGLTEHITTRIDQLNQRQLELKDIYLLAPWKTIRRRREFQRNLVTLQVLAHRLAVSQEVDKLRDSNITVLPVESPVNIPHDQDAQIIVLPLDNNTAAQDVFAIVDNS